MPEALLPGIPPAPPTPPDRDLVPAAPATLFGTRAPAAVIAQATDVATALAQVIKDRKLYKHIGQSDHVFVEGWTLLGSMLGVYAEVEWSRRLTDVDGFEAKAVAHTLDGRRVGAAEAMCTRKEAKWKGKDDFEVRSMAQTRAISKALRLPLGFIVELAGFAATPAEEMDTEHSERVTMNQANGEWSGIVRITDKPGSDMVLRTDAEQIFETGFRLELEHGIAQVVARGDIASQIFDGIEPFGPILHDGDRVTVKGVSETVHQQGSGRRRPYQRITANVIIGEANGETTGEPDEPEPEGEATDKMSDEEIDKLTS